MDNVDTLTPPEPQPQPQGSKGAFERIIGVFFEPSATFADIARAPAFIVPLILVVLVSMGSAMIVVNKVDMRDFMAKQIEKNPRMDSLSKEQKEQAIERGATFG